MKLGAIENWYKYDAQFSLNLLQSYINGIENQIQISINLYRSGKAEELIVLDEGRGIGQLVEFYGGLDSMDVDLNEIFESHFPNLQRRSAFLTLYAFLEHELERLCTKLEKHYELKASTSDISGKGITRSMIYMQKIALLDIDEKEMAWLKLKEINKIRNLLIHNDGQLSDHDGTKRKEMKMLSQLRQHISGTDELVIEVSFLPYVLTVFSQFFRIVSKAINDRSSNQENT